MFLFLMAQQPPVGQGPLSIEASRSHSDTPHSVGLLWASDKSAAGTLPNNTQHSQETNIHASGGIETHNPSIPVVANPRLRPCGHRDRQSLNTSSRKVGQQLLKMLGCYIQKDNYFFGLRPYVTEKGVCLTWTRMFLPFGCHLTANTVCRQYNKTANSVRYDIVHRRYHGVVLTFQYVRQSYRTRVNVISFRAH
jgi:hypothetical protein